MSCVPARSWIVCWLVVGLAGCLSPEDGEAVRSGLGERLECVGGPTSDIEVEFHCTSVAVASCKDISNVVLEFEDGAHQKFEDIDGNTGVFRGTGDHGGHLIVRAWVKAGRNHSGDGPGYGERFEGPAESCGPADEDEDGVPEDVDCDDSDPRVGRLLYETDFDVDDDSLQVGEKLTDPWLIGGGVASNTRGGQQALLGGSEDWVDTVTIARVAANGVERKCSRCGYRALGADRAGGVAHALSLAGPFDGDPAHVVTFSFVDVAVLHVDRRRGNAELAATLVLNDLGGGPGATGEEWQLSMRWSADGSGTLRLVEGHLRPSSGGAVLELTQEGAAGDLQVGEGANGVSANLGAFADFGFRLEGLEEPTIGTGELRLELEERDRYRAGILARSRADADQDEGFHGYRCAVARNSVVDCHRPGRFLQLAAFLDADEDDLHSECEGLPGACVENPTFDELDRTERGLESDVLSGDEVELTFWAVGDELVCELEGAAGERVEARVRDERFVGGGTGLSVLNAMADFKSVRVCEAFRVP